MSGLNSLATIMRRLEAATSRIEDVTSELENKYVIATPDGIRRATPELESAPTPTPPPPPSAPPAPPAPVASPPVSVAQTQDVIDFDDMIINGKLEPYLELTKAFGSASLTEQADLIEKLITALRSFLLVVAHCQKPDQQTLNTLLTPLQADIQAIMRQKEANRKDREWFNHLSTVAEGAPCVGWVTVPAPGQLVNDVRDSTVFYGNRIIKEYKGKDPRHAEWVKSYVGLLEQMRVYAMEHHKMGLMWNRTGVPVAQYIAALSSASAPAPLGASGGIAGVFVDLNRGEAVTKGLKKVDKSEMTHKNPALRSSSVVPASSSLNSAAKPTKAASSSGKPVKFALEGNKWVIEYQEGRSDLIIENCEINQTVNLFGCKNSTIHIKGKVNAVSLINCTKMSVLVESVVSAIIITNSASFALQIRGSAPTIQIDSTESGQVYLSQSCLGVEITTAKCSSINVSLPVEGEEEGVFGEHAVPEMLKTVVKGGKLVTTVVEHTG